ncbi:hypothetical protein ASE00_04030 [Sphingomonas sp. Root710]|uniref:hypothetical protein n=1 Tax=Sphingomonas sp. Root710 TaxID=1736594 RepID=UPI0006FAC9DB|nr:hypothetical protein [Sphingomonas sp. Root710]KRB85928.1 hypothetical protein ASE00_04030 [Sphingomonas sp. Root710]
MLIETYRRFRTPLFWALVAGAYVAAIVPSRQAPDIGAGDKVNHIAAFLVITLVGRTAYRRKPAWLLAGGLSLFGVLIELTQAIPALQRDASLWDWVADSIAILVALAAAGVIERWAPRLFAA